MTKGSSEATFGAALRGLDLALYVYKPPDDARNRKPCDFMVWHVAGVDERSIADLVADRRMYAFSTWFEVKDVTTVRGFNVNELRPAQKAGIRDAGAVGIPYWLAVYWRTLHAWTISRAYAVLEHAVAEGNTTVRRELLMSRFGIDSTPGQLGSNLKSVLLGDV